MSMMSRASLWIGSFAAKVICIEGIGTRNGRFHPENQSFMLHVENIRSIW